MSKFGEEFIFSFQVYKKFFRLPVVSVRENCYLVNEDSESVIKVQERKLLQSWRLKYPYNFTSPIAFDKEDDSIYCVVNNNVVLKWTSTLVTDDLYKNGSKFKFEEEVYGLIPVCHHRPLVLFKSGKIIGSEALTSESLPIGEGFITKGEKIIWADASALNSEINVVCLTQKPKILQLHHFSVNENKISKYHKHPVTHETDKLSDWCLNKSTQSFITIWSSGLVLNYDLRSQVESTLLILSDVGNHAFAIDCMNSNHLAIMKSIPKQKEACLEMWDAKYKVLKAKKVLKNETSSEIKLSVIDSAVLYSNDRELVEVPFNIENSTLAAAIGRSVTSDQKVLEFSFNNGKLIQLSNSEQNFIERMDISENEQNSVDSTELLAERLMEKSLYLNCIPEAELIKLLRLAIRCKFKKKKSNFDPDVVLCAVFSASYSEAFLVKYLKKLNADDTLIILKILLSFLNNEFSFTSTNIKKPSDLQLFNWIFLTIQSHMEVLLLSKDKKNRNLFKNLKDYITKQMEDCEGIENIQFLLDAIQKKKKIMPEKYTDEKYCIETLEE
ncbi:nucleolar protein 11 [Trichonephila clavata]|uniref:Nucleolar protein 11 n=1 Tax=Trichonephila clavata TaxID=2740835 RepID=A0A8X6LJY6_TRICU|nr:nucleolar protein 11 [Trichonephila clavata]